MKLYINTCDPESMCVEMTEKEDASLAASIEELAFGLSGLSLRYMLELKDVFDQSELLKTKKWIIELFSLILDKAFDEDILGKNDSDDDSSDEDTEELYAKNQCDLDE